MGFSFSSISDFFRRNCTRIGSIRSGINGRTISCTIGGKDCRGQAKALHGSGGCSIRSSKLIVEGSTRCTSRIRSGNCRISANTTLFTREQLGRRVG